MGAEAIRQWTRQRVADGHADERGQDEPLRLPVALSMLVGAGLLAWAALVAWVSVSASPALATEVALANVVWVAASVVFAFAGWAKLTGLGVGFVLLQAAAVAAITAMQAAGVRSSRRVAAVPA
jgi:hypothetical protein